MLRYNYYGFIGGVLLLLMSADIMAKPEYTYVKASLGYPWFMFFVFMVLISIPFLLIIILSWKIHLKKDDNQ